MKVLSLLLRNQRVQNTPFPHDIASMKVLSLLLRNITQSRRVAGKKQASMKVLSLLLRNRRTIMTICQMAASLNESPELIAQELRVEDVARVAAQMPQ